jgi:hypothetical protein
MVFLFICCQVAAIRQPDKHHGICQSDCELLRCGSPRVGSHVYLAVAQ